MTYGKVSLFLAALVGFGCTRTDAPASSPRERAAESQIVVPPAGADDAELLPASLDVGRAAGVEQRERRPDVVYVPTPQPVVDKMLEIARVSGNDIVYDLGCGDGRIVVTAAKRYGARAFGFDVDPNRVAEARENVRKNGVEDLVTIEQRDIFKLDLRPANVVTLYLLPDLNVKLIPQLERLRPGSRVVSHDFDMRGVKPALKLEFTAPGTSRAHLIYLFNVPLEKEEATTTSR
jgi:SAM-dependent methyltransferase